MKDEPVITDLTFPVRGLDLSRAFGVQRADTCCEGINVLGAEPTTGRMRGGQRAGLSRYPDDLIPSGAHLIQDLACVIYGDTGALPDLFPPGGTDLMDDPSDAGPPGSWGAGPIDWNWNGAPITGGGLGTRNPGPRKIRRKGSGYQPNKNHVTLAPPNSVSYLYQCIAEVTVVAPGHAFDGTTPSFDGCVCVGQIYQALAGAPTTSLQFRKWHLNRAAYFALHAIPDGAWTFLPATDFITGPVRQCTASDLATCTLVTGGTSGTYPGG